MNKQAKTLLSAALGCIVFGAGLLIGANQVEKPTTVLHVVTVNWKNDASPQAIQSALDGVANMKYDGLKRVWLKSFKSQTKDAAFVMEFESKKALEDYAGSPAQEEWYKLYLPIREASVTSDITN